MDPSQLDIDKLLRWSAPKVIATRNGLRNLVIARPTKKFIRLWDEHKRDMRKAGLDYGYNSYLKEFEVKWWRSAGLDQEAIEDSRQAAGTTAGGQTIELKVPEGLDYFPFQKNGIAYCLERKNVLIGDEMGLGKTIQSIGVINNATPDIDRFLIVCPMSLKRNWLREMERWLVHRDYTLTSIESKTPLPAEARAGGVISYGLMANRIEEFVEQMQDQSWGLLNFDECHFLKDEKAKRTQAAMRLKGDRTLMLTGTPMLNRPKDMWPVLRKLDPKTWWARKNYVKRYCGGKQVYIGSGRYAWDDTGASNLKELQQRLRSSVMIRRLKKDVLKELPEKMRSVFPMELTGKERTAHVRAEAKLTTFEEMLLRLYQEKSRGADSAKIPFQEVSAIRAEMGLAKAPAVASQVSEMLDSVDKIVVFAHHREVVALIAEHLSDVGHSVVTLTGATPEKKRDEAVTEFQDNPDCEVFVGSIGAAGVGLTLTSASDVVFAELPWRPSDVLQAEDRCHRIGQASSVNIKYFVYPGGIDEKLAEKLVSKKINADQTLDIAPTEEELILPAEDITEITLTKMTPPTDRELAVLQGLQRLSMMCDGATTLDGQGFSRITAGAGHSLAKEERLTPKQIFLGVRICTLHKGQLPDDLLQRISDTAPPPPPAPAREPEENLMM